MPLIVKPFSNVNVNRCEHFDHRKADHKNEEELVDNENENAQLSKRVERRCCAKCIGNLRKDSAFSKTKLADYGLRSSSHLAHIFANGDNYYSI